MLTANPPIEMIELSIRGSDIPLMTTKLGISGKSIFEGIITVLVCGESALSIGTKIPKMIRPKAIKTRRLVFRCISLSPSLILKES
jgi:hypothetical protein